MRFSESPAQSPAPAEAPRRAEAAAEAAPRPAPLAAKSEYIKDQAEKAVQLYKTRHDGEWQRQKPEIVRELAAREWLGLGYARAYSRARQKLIGEGDYRLPELEEVVPQPGDEDESVLRLHLPDGQAPLL